MRSLERIVRGGIVALLLAVPAPVAAQTTLDEGTFRLVVDGHEIGTETFVIRLTGSGAGAEVSAQGRVALDAAQGENVVTALQFAGPGLRPATYDIRAGDERERLSGRVAGRRVSARIVSSSGENVREYLVSEGAVVIDGAIAHQHYFLARRVREGERRIPVIVPREARQTWLDVEVQPEETLNVAGTAIVCQKLLLRPESGEVRLLWTDADDRIIRLEIPGQKFIAERTAAPR